MPKLHLTAEVVNKLPTAEAGQALYRDTKLQGFGLRVGKLTKVYFAEKRVDGRTVRVTLGTHGQITAAQAREKAMSALGRLASGVDMNAEERAKREERQAHRDAKARAAEYTLGKLCDWYVEHQRKRGKSSAADAENLFKNYVKGSDFEPVPARDLTSKQATALIRAVVEAGKGRTAAKLRAYLRAAYALALGAETNPEAPSELVLFGVDTNPIAATGALSSFSKSRDVVLTEAELGEFVRLLQERRAAQFDDALAAIELALFLGGQRLTQVLRLTLHSVDTDAGTVVLLDPKGRRKEARRHVLPLQGHALALTEQILDLRRAEWVFGDKSAQTTPDTVARKGGELLVLTQANLQKGAKAKREPRLIQVRDLRRTAETMMAAMGISKDLRAQIQSHGLGGVQDRHYDRHDYMQEKRRALEAWEARLNELAERKPAASNVKKLNRA